MSRKSEDRDSTWWMVVTLGGPIRPTGWAVLERVEQPQPRSVLHRSGSLYREAPEPEVAELLGNLAARVMREQPVTVVLVRTAGIGVEMVDIWERWMPTSGRCAVRRSRNPESTSDLHAGFPGRTQIQTAVHVELAHRRLTADDDTLTACSLYTGKTPKLAEGQDLADLYDGDPDGIVLPLGLALHYSDPSRRPQVTVPAVSRDRVQWSADPRQDQHRGARIGRRQWEPGPPVPPDSRGIVWREW